MLTIAKSKTGMRMRPRIARNRICVCNHLNTGYCTSKQTTCHHDESCEEIIERTVNANVESEMAAFS
ncbi:hypothetical protein C4572_00060 [Candidatus Parcubacteria bacterium]|nr:MAG: hypothetical protein C4572_00060 [Candidatus Parcubacteria bacterium]